MEGVVYCNAYTLLTVAKAEGAAEFNLFLKFVFSDEALKLLNYLA